MTPRETSLALALHTCGKLFSESATWVAPPCPLRPFPGLESDAVLVGWVYGNPISWGMVRHAHRALVLADQSYDSDVAPGGSGAAR